MEFRDYYKTLGVERTAAENEIKSSFRKLARKFHPDVNPNNKDAEKRFKEINEAYQVLSDPEKRKKYDLLGADWERGAAEEEVRRRYGAHGGFAGGGRGFESSGSTDFSDFFESFFGGAGMRGRAGGRGNPFGDGGFDFSSRPSKAPDLEAEVPISLEEAVAGAKRRLDLTADDECATCAGSGAVMDEDKQGKTRVIRAARQCPTCGGSGIVRNRRTLEVTIPAGVADGTRLRLKGQGGRAPRPDHNGDLYITVRLNRDRRFTVEGRDLRCILPVWDYEAALGAEVTVPTVTGRLSLKIPAGSQAGRVMRLRGKGLPVRGKDPSGDLLYELRVLAPTDMTAEERHLMEEMADKRKSRGVPDPRAELLRG